MNTKAKTKRTPDEVEYRTVASDKTKGLDFVLSDATPDRYDDIILTAGWKLDNFNNNPIALFAHMGSFPVGNWKNVRVEENALRGTLVLAKEGTSDRIDEIRKLVDAGILKAVSVGFTPISYEERKGDTYGLVYTEQELVECSLVSVPANPNALLLAKELKISADTQELVFGKQAVVKKTLIKDTSGERRTLDIEEELGRLYKIINDRDSKLQRDGYSLDEINKDPDQKRRKKRRKDLEELLNNRRR
jgi:HK97 family phage prohead protease